jgi:hypothetical protein
LQFHIPGALTHLAGTQLRDAPHSQSWQVAYVIITRPTHSDHYAALRRHHASSPLLPPPAPTSPVGAALRRHGYTTFSSCSGQTPRLGAALLRHHRAPVPFRSLPVAWRASRRHHNAPFRPLGVQVPGASAVVLSRRWSGSTAALYSHVPSRLFSADSRCRVPKGPAGRSRAGIHTSCSKQEGSVPRVCGQLPRALLPGGPA